MGLFDKKYCDICGEKIGFLGNRKLEDGNLCKDCANKLSPWFPDRRQSTVADIRAQLDYREANKSAVAAFCVTRTLGSGTKVLLDEGHNKFIVTSERDFVKANPDVLDFSQVTGCRSDVNESRRELKRRDSEGKYVSYNPARYEYSYNFYIIINVNSPYFSEMRFRVNDSTVDINNLSSGPMVRSVNPRNSIDYLEYEKLCKEIVDALSKARENVRESVEAANAPKATVQCPYCDAVVIPDANGRCEFCGSVISK